MSCVLMLVDLHLQLMFEVLRFECDATLQHRDRIILLLHFQSQVGHLGLEFLTVREVSEMCRVQK